jgi:Raf kinase inhibitor-like YbhB/YbcL family protein
MSNQFKLIINDWANAAPIPTQFAFGKISPTEHVALSENLNPQVAWENAPTGTQSFVIICHDPDVPSSGEDVNQEGKVVPSDLPRVDFFHWVLVDIPATTTSIAEGAASNGVTAGGKPGGERLYGKAGINSYTDWFAGDKDMGGDYCDYDGPCPPWNDSLMHHYHFTVYALDVESLNLNARFDGNDARAAMQGHVLAESEHVGIYTLNPDL